MQPTCQWRIMLSEVDQFSNPVTLHVVLTGLAGFAPHNWFHEADYSILHPSAYKWLTAQKCLLASIPLSSEHKVTCGST